MSEISEKPVPPAESSRPMPSAAVTVPEAIPALIVLSHGCVFLFPPNTFSLSINYRVMQSIAPEWFWGGAFLALFVVWVASFIRKMPRLRKAMLTVFGLCLLGMGVSFFLSNVNTTIGYTLIIVGAGSLVARVQMR